VNKKIPIIFSFILGCIFAFSITYNLMNNVNKEERIELAKLRKELIQYEEGINIPNPLKSLSGKLGKMKKHMQDMMEEEEKALEEQATIFQGIAQGLSNIGSVFDVGETTEREDDQFYYFDVKVGSSEQNEIDVNVKDGYLSVSGKVVSNKGEGSFKSTFTSSFSKSFPVPANVYANRFKIDQDTEKGLLIIKFPKK